VIAMKSLRAAAVVLAISVLGACGSNSRVVGPKKASQQAPTTTAVSTAPAVSTTAVQAPSQSTAASVDAALTSVDQALQQVDASLSSADDSRSKSDG
jgi:hypothetical protein